MKKTLVLVILDGWGIGRADGTNPIHTVAPQTLLDLEKRFPVTSLQASGISVGLPWGEIGNSEVGHLTLGAGKVIYQYYPRITLAIRDKTFFENPALKNAFAHAKENNAAVNLIGLLTKANVHASIEHLLALIEMGTKEEVPIKLHLFGDGKDGTPRTFLDLLAQVPHDMIGSLSGRYYAMDREGNWDFTRQTYEAIVGKTRLTSLNDLPAIVKETYERQGSEEYLPPLLLNLQNAVSANDALIFFNFREDSIRELAESFIQTEFDHFPHTIPENLFVVTMTQYKETFAVPVAFPPDSVKNPLGKVLSDAGKNQLRLAETYKYAHITYFFNGFAEAPYPNEYRVLVPSEAIPHPDEHPAMMASALTDRLLQALENNAFDFILVNYANGDAIAHTGNFDASEDAVRAVDRELGRIMKVLNKDITILITSDHGNVEEVINPRTGAMETGHNPSPVPFYLISPQFEGRKFFNQETRATETSGILSDVAPTILELMGIKKPDEMTGRSLLRNLI